MRLVFEGALLDQDTHTWLDPFSVEVEGYEWVDATGAWNLELATGRAQVAETLPDGSSRPITARARLERYFSVGLLEVLADGSRMWSLRGDLYLEAPGHPLVEMEAGLQGLLPPAGQTRRPPPRPRLDDEADDVYAGRVMLDLVGSGDGGGLVYGNPEPMWGRPAPSVPYVGWLRAVELSVTQTTRARADRDADRLISRILYVSTDYGLAVRGNEVVDPGEYTEQHRLLQEARVIAEGLPLDAALRDRIAAVRDLVSLKTDPEVVQTACVELARALEAELALLTSSPEPAGRGDALYAQHCASCHGAAGEGPPPGLALDPPPPALASPEVRAGLSPYRAWSAISWGVEGTAMTGFERTLSSGERWALAFEVSRLGRDATAPSGRPPTLEELAVRTDADLLSELGTPAEVDAWRTGGTTAAAASPWLPIRRDVRRAARLGGGPEAEAAVGAASASFTTLAPAGPEAEAVRQALDALLGAVRGGDEEIVAAAATRALTSLVALERAPAPRSGGALWALLAGVLALPALGWALSRSRA